MAVRWSGRRVAPGVGEWPYPTGDQWSITAAGHRATIVAVGGGVREYGLVDRQPVLAGYSVESMAPGAAGQVLSPWPNRLAGGTYTFAGVTHQLAITEPASGSAIHGLVRWLVWELVERRDDEVVVGCRLPPQPGYPWPLQFTTRWTVSSDGLRAAHTVTNMGSVPAPFGFGAHPYVWIDGVALAELMLQVPMALRVVPDGNGGSVLEPVLGTPYDFIAQRRLGELRLDDTFTRVLAGADGTARTRLATVDGRRGVEVWQDNGFGWLQLYNGPGPTGRGGQTLAIEPMTCPPQAMRTGEDLIQLLPGEPWTGSWGVRPYA